MFFLLNKQRKLFTIALVLSLSSCGLFSEEPAWKAGYSEKVCYAGLKHQLNIDSEKFYIGIFLDMFSPFDDQYDVGGLQEVKRNEKVFSAYIPVSDMNYSDKEFYPDEVIIRVGEKSYTMHLNHPADEIGQFFMAGTSAKKVWEGIKSKEKVFVHLKIKEIGEKEIQIPYSGIDVVSAMYEACKAEAQKIRQAIVEK